MQATPPFPTGPTAEDRIDPDAAAFYRRVLETLNAAELPFLVGGGFAFTQLTGLERPAKDLDLFIARDDYERIAQCLRQAGYSTELTYPHWLAKVHADDAYIDLIFNSGNGVAPVDEAWFEHACPARLLGVPVKFVPAEEGIWSKAFVMERERYDGADVAHLLRACAARLDWPRLLRRFGPHWRVLLSHLVLFGFIYPGHRALIPGALLDDLMKQMREEARHPPPQGKLCAGTLLSREQYLHDIEQQGYHDVRMTPLSTMQEQDVADWTDAIGNRQPPADAGPQREGA